MTEHLARPTNTLLLATIICVAVLWATSVSGQEASPGGSELNRLFPLETNVWDAYLEHKGPTQVATGIEGNDWREMSDPQKYGTLWGYDQGFKSGVFFGWITAGKPANAFPFATGKPAIDFGHLVEAVDEFYSDYANRGIFLPMALPIVIGRIEGYLSDDEAEEEILLARQLSATLRKYLNE